jgi:hypothetical protein
VATGYRMLKILKLLMQKPCSTAEINEAFQDDSHLQKAVSDDMICLYVNSLRKIGCDISRPSKTNSFCYVLNTNPFLFRFSKQNSKTIETILRSLVKNNDWRLLLDVCEFFKDVKDVCSKDSDLDFLRVVSVFMKMDFDLIKKLNYFCEKEKFVVLEYQSPNSGLKEISLVAKYLRLENSRLYLWGHSFELDELQYLRVDRIKNIKVISLKEFDIEQKDFPVSKYKLLNQEAKNFLADENQKVIKMAGREIFIEESIKNKFLFIQKILSYGEDCVVLEPVELRQEIVSAIKGVLAFYE